MASVELSCREMVELITDYLENALSPEDRVRFESHLSGCTDCTQYLEQMRWSIWFSGTLTEEHIAPDAKDALLHLFRNWKNSKD